MCIGFLLKSNQSRSLFRNGHQDRPIDVSRHAGAVARRVCLDMIWTLNNLLRPDGHHISSTASLFLLLYISMNKALLIIITNLSRHVVFIGLISSRKICLGSNFRSRTYSASQLSSLTNGNRGVWRTSGQLTTYGS